MLLTELADDGKKIKHKALNNMKFMGNLYLRSILTAENIGFVLQDLLSRDVLEEHKIECAIELLTSVGYTLETSQGEAHVQKFIARLKDLKRGSLLKGRPAPSRRVQFAIQDLVDLKNSGWRRKIFKEQAKKKVDIREDALRDYRKGAEVFFATQTAGMRPQEHEQFKVKDVSDLKSSASKPRSARSIFFRLKGL